MMCRDHFQGPEWPSGGATGFPKWLKMTLLWPYATLVGPNWLTRVDQSWIKAGHGQGVGTFPPGQEWA